MERQRYLFTLSGLRAAVRGLVLFILLIGFTIPFSPASAPLVNAAAAAPTIDSLSISEAPNDLDTNLIITGTSFSTPLTVQLGAITLPFPRVNPEGTQIQLAVPWGLTPGVYDLTVTNNEGSSASTPFTVLPGINSLTGEGPYGGGVLSMEVYPYDTSVVLADMGMAGLFRTLDAGESWQPIFQPADYFTSLEMDWSNPDLVFITRQGDGLYRSGEASVPGDISASWQKMNLPLTGAVGHIRPFVHPRRAGVVFAAAYENEDTCGYFACALFRSTNYGDTWTAVPAPKLSDGSDAHVVTMAFHPTDNNTYYASTNTSHIFKTTDDGATWTDLGTIFNYWTPIELIVPPTSPDTVWAYGMDGIHHDDEAYGHWHFLAIYKDGTWTLPEGAIPAGDQRYQICQIQYDPRQDTPRLMAVTAGGIFTSTDGGGSFTLLSDKLMGPCGSVGLDPANKGIFYASYNQRGVFRTLDDGQSYQPKSKGLTGFTITDLRISPQDTATVYAVSQDVALFKTTNGGASWHELPVDVQPGAISPLLTDPSTDGRLYLGSFFSYYTAVNGGETQADWQMVSMNTNDPNAHPDLLPASFSTCWLRESQSFAVAKGVAGEKDRLFMGVSYENCSDPEVPGMIVYASEDQGNHWAPVFQTTAHTFPTFLVVDPADPKRIFLGASTEKYSVNYVYYSQDGGAAGTWHDAQTNLPGRMLQFMTVGKNHALLGAEGPYLVSSADNGKTWVTVSHAGSAIAKIIYDPALFGMYAATFTSLRVTYDNGKTWQSVPGSLGQMNITALAARQVDNRTIFYASTPGMTIGGQAETTAGAPARSTAGEEILGGGVYRYTLVQTKLYLPFVKR